MMDNLRSSANHLVLKIVLGVIIVSFILTGVSNYLIGGGANYAVKVNGQEISRSQFENAVAGELNSQKQQLGEQFSALAGNEAYIKQLREKVLSRMIDEALLDQYAKSLGLSTSDEQIKQAIFKEPAFQSNGKFDNARYNAIINNIGMTADQYAQGLRSQLTTQQLINALVSTDFMLSSETDTLAALSSQQRLVREATIDVSALAAKQTATEQDVSAFYQQNKSRYQSPEQFKVAYIKLDAASMSETASDGDIQAYYDQHQDQFTQPPRMRYSVIQTKTQADAQAVLDKLHQGGDFATLAKEKSVDIISARNGGDMGWLEPATTADELKSAGLKEKGQLSGVIKSSVGFLVVRLDDVQPAATKPLTEVRETIANSVKQQKSLDAYYALQQKVSEAATSDNMSLNSAASVAGVKAIETDWFSRDNLPAELNFKPVSDAIFNGGLVGDNGTPGNNSDIITVDGDRAFVLRVMEHKAQAVKPLADVRDQVVAEFKQQKAEQLAKQQANTLLNQLKTGKGDDALKAAGLTFGEIKTLTRVNQDPVSTAAFLLTPPAQGHVAYGVADDSNGNIVLLSLEQVKAGTMEATEKKAMAQAMTQNNAQIVFEALMSNLRNKATIKMGNILEQQQ